MNALTTKEQKAVRTALRFLRLRVGAWGPLAKALVSQLTASEVAECEARQSLTASDIPGDKPIKRAGDRRVGLPGRLRPAIPVAPVSPLGRAGWSMPRYGFPSPWDLHRGNTVDARQRPREARPRRGSSERARGQPRSHLVPLPPWQFQQNTRGPPV